MKKLLLLLASGSIALNAGAQERRAGVMLPGNEKVQNTTARLAPIGATAFDFTKSYKPLAKTTGPGGSRWYIYADHLATIYDPLGYNLDYQSPYLWEDTSAVAAYGATGGGTVFNHITLTSVGSTFDPFLTTWNDPLLYAGIRVSAADAYKIDSVSTLGSYYRDPADMTSVDTLIYALVYGNGSPTSNIGSNGWIGTGPGTFPYTNYGIDTLIYAQLNYDSINNRADTNGFLPLPTVIKLPLTASDTGGFYRTVFVPGSGSGLTIPAGNYVGLSVSFKSGTPMAPKMLTSTFGDTVFRGSGTTGLPFNKYGMYRPSVQYKGSGATADYPVYSRFDQNNGFFKFLGRPSWGGIYLPEWAFGVTEASPYQQPVSAFHVACPACDTIGTVIIPPIDHTSLNEASFINSVSIAPNPAATQVAVSFNLAARTSVSVSLTNVVGQVVATQQLESIANGKVVFNTSAIANGVYFVTINANGQRSTGRVVVAH